MSRCLSCFGELPPQHRPLRYHPACARRLFGTPEPPILPWTLDELRDKAALCALAHSVPGVQPKMAALPLTKLGALPSRWLARTS